MHHCRALSDSIPRGFGRFSIRLADCLPSVQLQVISLHVVVDSMWGDITRPQTASTAPCCRNHWRTAMRKVVTSSHGGCKPGHQVNDKEEELEDQENGDDISAWDG